MACCTPSMPLEATLAPHSIPMYDAPMTTQCPFRLLHSWRAQQGPTQHQANLMQRSKVWELHCVPLYLH